MITKKRVLLVVTNQKGFDFLSRFEGIKGILSVEDIEEAFTKNKTPCILQESGSIGLIKYPLIYVPNFEDPEDFIEFSHGNGYECGEFKTGEVFDTNEERCFLCEIANLKGFSFLEKYNEFIDEKDCIIYESKNFFVVPEYGAIKPGFLMICPKEHFLSMATLPEEYMSEYEQVCSDVETILKATYGEKKKVIFFEHGSNPNGKSSHKRSVVHAHTHVVVDFVLRQKYLDMVQMKPLDNLSEAKCGHYLSYKEGADGQLLICMDSEVYVQRQYPRQIMAEELHLAPGQYNWRNVSFSENIHATLYRLHLCLTEKHNYMPERIRIRTAGFVNGYKKPKPEV